jgi:mono/diheme cytochrome c family protein
MTLTLALPTIAVASLVTAMNGRPTGGEARGGDEAQIRRGRQLVNEYACGGCHGGADPASDGWLAGYSGQLPRGLEDFQIGPFHTYARNLTPDPVTGLGRFSERQIFNALRYGLRPGDTPDIEITSSTPGEGNFPMNPKYLAPPMPWPAWRHMPDEDLWAIAAYLKHGLKPVRRQVEDSEGPPDFWAGTYTVDIIGTYPAAPFPTAKETMPPAGVDREKVLRGRQVVLSHACSDCHSGFSNPTAADWLIGITRPEQEFRFGACASDPSATPCFHIRARNLTPDEETGAGRYSERQIFNVLRYGLSPRQTGDIEVNGSVPGQGNFPAHPTYLAPGMPWQYWRHMPDADLWAAAAYLKYGLKPVRHVVQDTDAPPEGWAGEYTVEKIGPYPAPAFPTKNEVGG